MNCIGFPNRFLAAAQTLPAARPKRHAKGRPCLQSKGVGVARYNRLERSPARLKSKALASASAKHTLRKISAPESASIKVSAYAGASPVLSSGGTSISAQIATQTPASIANTTCGGRASSKRQKRPRENARRHVPQC